MIVWIWKNKGRIISLGYKTCQSVSWYQHRRPPLFWTKNHNNHKKSIPWSIFLLSKTI